jgi:hypothetical protein
MVIKRSVNSIAWLKIDAGVDVIPFINRSSLFYSAPLVSEFDTRDTVTLSRFYGDASHRIHLLNFKGQ